MSQNLQCLADSITIIEETPNGKLYFLYCDLDYGNMHYE